MMSHTRVTSSAAPRISCPVLVSASVVMMFAIVSVFAGPATAAARPRSPAQAHACKTSQPAQAEVPVATVAVVPGALWRGPGGQPLPFSTHAEAVEFLRSAKVVSRTELPSGWTRPQKLLLEKDGIRLHTIFRTFERVQGRIEDPLTRQLITGDVKDSAMFEVAAYELDKFLGLAMVPPTVERSIRGRRGCAQLWVEGEVLATASEDPDDLELWRQQVSTMWLFDYLTANTDRHLNNALITPDSRPFQWIGQLTS